MENIALNLFVSLLLGAAIGLERESSVENNAHAVAGGGVRTFALVALLGSLAGLFYIHNLPLVFAFMSAGFLIILSAYYVLASNKTQDFGITTEISFILTYLIGVAATTNIIPLQLVVAIAVTLILVLALKGKSRAFASSVSDHELQSFVSYGIIALVILPFLPSIAYTVSDLPFLASLLEGFKVDISRFAGLELLNPRKLWFIVVLVTGIDVLGYVLSKFIGAKRGFTFTSFIAGFVSSTSATQSLAQRSSTTTGTSNYLIGAALLANLASFFQVFLLVGPLNSGWLVYIFPTLVVIIITAAILSYYFIRQKHDEEQATSDENKKIFSLVPALKFAVLLVIVKIVTGICLILFGQSGFLISSLIASFVGLDAILVNLATMAGGAITFQFALIAFVLVNATNLLSKSFFSFLQGSRTFAFKFFISALIIIAASGLGLLVL